MARVTVEDCIDKVDSPYELVLVAKERATQLNSGVEPTIDRDNDKNTVIALREIAEENIKVPDLTESAVYKLRKHVEQVEDVSEDDEEVGDDFENLYKGEISKSGVPILPSKRARKIPEKIQVSKEDLAELENSPEEQSIESEPSEESTETQEGDVSLDNLKDEEIASEEQKDSDTYYQYLFHDECNTGTTNTSSCVNTNWNNTASNTSLENGGSLYGTSVTIDCSDPLNDVSCPGYWDAYDDLQCDLDPQYGPFLSLIHI